VLKSPKTLILILIVLLAVLAGGILLKSTINNSANRHRVDETVEVDSEQKEGLVGENSIPQNFPQDFPIYLNTKLEIAYTSKGEEIEAISIIWISNDTLKQVSDFYKIELTNKGWVVAPGHEDEKSIVFSVDKGGTFGFIGIGKGENGKTIISVTIQVDNKNQAL